MIIAKNLTKIYKVPAEKYKKNIYNILWPPQVEKVGVKNINLNIKDGEIVSLAGLNGAGKTTIIKMMAGILTPTDGQINIDGYIPYKNRRKYTKQIGVLMGQKSILFYDIPVIESLKFYKDVYSIDDSAFMNRLELLTKKLDLQPLLHIPVRKLSLGQRTKCEVAASILHNPKILFLDEPTLGLDIISKQQVLEFFKYLNNEFGTTIFLTTHDISDIDRFCNRIIIIDHGEIKYDDTISKINDRNKYKVIEISHSSDIIIQNIISIPYNIIYQGENRTCIKVNKIYLDAVINKLINNNDIYDLNFNTISLEQVLYEIYVNKGDKYV